MFRTSAVVMGFMGSSAVTLERMFVALVFDSSAVTLERKSVVLVVADNPVVTLVSRGSAIVTTTSGFS